LGSVDKPLACPLLYFRATSVACPETRCFLQETRPTLPLAGSSSLPSATLQHFEAKPPLFSPGSRRTFERHGPVFQRCRPQGLATLSAVSAAQPTGTLFQPPTLLGFTLQSLVPISWPTHDFSRVLRSCVFLPNPPAWHRRFNGFRSRDQLRYRLPAFFTIPAGATALLGFYTFRVSFRRILGGAPSFPLPLSFFSYRPPQMSINGTPGDPFRRLSNSLLSKGAHPPGVADRLSSATS